jgi:hypothetical protein
MNAADWPVAPRECGPKDREQLPNDERLFLSKKIKPIDANSVDR